MSASVNGTLGFQRIPPNLLVPLFFVEFNNSFAGVNLFTKPRLLIGQGLTNTGQAPQYCPSVAWAQQEFGATSMIARMAQVYFLQDNVGPLYLLALADAPGSAKATFTATFTAATGSGTLWLYIGGQLVQVGVNNGDTAAVIATNVAAVVNGSPLILPVTATAVGGVVTFTAAHGGALGNALDIRLNYLGSQSGQITPAGVTMTVTNDNTGTLDPDLGGVAALCGDRAFDYIGHPYGEASQIAEISAMLNDQTGRWAYNRQVYGHAFTGMMGTPTALSTTGVSFNDQHGTIFGVPPTTPTPIDEIVADAVGAYAPRSAVLASRPVMNAPLLSTKGPTPNNWFNFSAKQQLLSSGISPIDCSDYGPPAIIRAITTYQRNAFGSPDQSYLDSETLFTLMEVVRRMKAAVISLTGNGVLLVPDGTRLGTGVPAFSPSGIKSHIIAPVYYQAEEDGLLTNADAALAATVVRINPQNPTRADVGFVPYLANGLRDMATMVNFVLNPSSAALAA